MYKRRNNRGERRSGIGSSFISGGEVVCVQKEATQSNQNRNSNTGGSEAGDEREGNTPLVPLSHFSFLFACSPPSDEGLPIKTFQNQKGNFCLDRGFGRALA